MCHNMKVLTNELPLQLTSHSSTLALPINVGQTLTECTKTSAFSDNGNNH